ncbi:transcriptional regulator, GntR family [Pseudonocardia dioxanivorans CB1190]|uniref:Transcriptional regulator, GntR family n=1 Tax=Pseudonocardia dioxanivorans (strain ATCC 55486 / DSM 44775 / JCM 13855 / CB1190) TaxID=675635 RepID=F4CMF8_PSEUX|nr:GntR family transcriptional regulator [Pseudonocardia dioxanivorans]AEA23585.1 transcriptional regulator, GntR family [Pseudonocardia dioxanivorans CB1190]
MSGDTAEIDAARGRAGEIDAARGRAGENDAARGRAGEIVEALQRRILMGEVPVGSWLRHEALAAEFGTSRTPVREALRILDAQGVVTIVRNRGARVDGHSGRDLRELGEVRAELEGFAAQLAAERIDDAQLERLRGAWHGFRRAIEEFVDLPAAERTVRTAPAWVEANGRFHVLVAEASGNRQLAHTIADIHRRLPQNISFAAYAGRVRLLRRNLAEHDEITDAIARGDGVSARAAMTAHIRNAVEATSRWAEDNGLVRERY